MRDTLQKLQDIFGSFGVADAADIIVLAVLVYALLRVMDTNSVKAAGWLLGGLTACFFCVAFGLPYAGYLVRFALPLFALFVFALYPAEIKRSIWRRSRRTASDVQSDRYDCTDEELADAMGEIIKAVQNMAKKDIGALIVMVQGEPPAGIIESGTVLNSVVSAPLLESIFHPKTPLHDGAVLIKGNEILAAGCFLPLSLELNLPKEIGTRHRAGIGISESHNVVAIVVSEETGIISLCEAGKITRYVDSNMLKENLERVYGLSLHTEGHTVRWSLRKNERRK